LGESQDQEEYKALTKTYSQALEYSKAEFGEATRLWNDIMILDDLGEYENADERLLEARSGYVTAFRKEHLPRLNSQYGRTLLSFVAGEGHEDIVKLLLETVDPDLKDGKSGWTPLRWAARNGHEAVVKLLLETGKVKADSKDERRRTPLW
jgi:ankyrin repeat protein